MEMETSILSNCGLDHLSPSLKKLAKEYIDCTDRVILAYEQIEKCSRTAFILTRNSVVCASFLKNENEKKPQGTVKVMPIADISDIKEMYQYNPRASLIIIHEISPNIHSVILPFLIKDDVYRKFIRTLFDLVEECQPGNVVCNRSS